MSEVHGPDNEGGYCQICCKGYAFGPHVCPPMTEERLRNTRAWAAARLGQLSGANVIVAAIDELLKRRADELPAPLPAYTREVGEAAEAYVKSKGYEIERLPGGFYWHELWEAMCAAVKYPPECETRELWMAWCDQEWAWAEAHAAPKGWIAAGLGSRDTQKEMQRVINEDKHYAKRRKIDWVSLQAVRITVHVGELYVGERK